MAPNKRKILEAARKYAQKGNKDRALREYEKLQKLDPRDAKLRLEIGDAHRRWGQVEEAVAAYAKVADQYMHEGFDARAVAVYKQIQSLDPERFDSYVPLADLYQRMGLASEAIQALQTAADGYHKQGKKREALELLRKMATLDPSNTTSRIKVADLLRQEGMESEAIAEYEAAREELERQGEQEAASTVLERILEIDGERVPTLVALTRNLLARGFAERAEPFARRALELEGDEVAHHELLADVYRAQQREDEMVATYRGLAELYRQRGDDEKARDIIQRFAPPEFTAPLEPDSADLGAAREEPGLLDDALLDDGDPLAGDEVDLEEEAVELGEEPLLELDEEMASVSETPAPPRAEPAPEEIDGDPEQLLAEASVYLRYGKRAQAIRNLEAILAREPDHRGALEKLGEAHADADDAPAAVAAWQRAAACARDSNDLSGHAVLRDRIAALDPEAAEALGEAPTAAADEPLIDLDAEERDRGDAPPPEVVDELDLDDEIEIDLDDEPRAEAREAAPTPLQEAAAKADAGAGSMSKQRIQDEIDEAEFYHQQGLFDEARAIYERVLEAAPNHPLALVRMGEIEAGERGDAAGPAATSAAREEPPTMEERPAFDGGGDLEIGDEDDAWTDGGLEEDQVGLEEDHVGLEEDHGGLEEDDAGLSAEGGAPPDTVEIEVDLPEMDLDEPDLDLDPGPARADDTPLAGDTASTEIALPQVPPEAPEVEALAPPPEPEVEASVPPPEPLVEASVPSPEPMGAGAPAEAPPDDLRPEPVAVDVPDEEVVAGLTSDPPGETFDDLVIEANAGPARDAAGDSFDLAAELAGAFEEDSSGNTSAGSLASMSEQDVFAAVFSEFKRGVDRTLGEGDHEARYDLGIAYREMGLLDDALREFQAAARSPARRVDCLHMMGLCAIDLGRAEEATAHFQQALGTPDLSREHSLGLRFELGRAFEVLEDLDRAREAWQAVAAVDPTFCEVEERLACLGQAKPEPEDGGLESFDDLFDEDDPEVVDAEAGGESFDDLVREANADAPEHPDPEDSGELGVDEVAADSAPAVGGAPRRRKKKISFV